jgi:hypothetical protein
MLVVIFERKHIGAQIVLWQGCDEIGQHFKAKVYTIKFKVFQLCRMVNNGQDVGCDIWEKA